MVPLLPLMRRSLRGCLSPKRKRRKVHRPLAPLTYEMHFLCLNQCWKNKPQSLQDGEKVLHPSQLVVAAGDIPWPTRIPKSRVEMKQIPPMISMRLPVSPPKTPTQPHTLTIDACFGTCMTADPTPRLHWSNCLFMCSQIGRSRS